MDYRRARQYLSRFENFEHKLSSLRLRALHLERVADVLARIGNPHLGIKTVHIAGSKGKGSTAALTASILREAGYTVGLYTSPHLYHERERIRILRPGLDSAAADPDEVFRDCISKEDLCRIITELREVLDVARVHPQFGALTYFEVWTVLAFYFFKQQKVDLVVLETGLGGRLDATNVCVPLVCAITSISLEHTQQLGKTLAAIAAEKAGIIKRPAGLTAAPVVVAPQDIEVLRVISRRCQEVGARMVKVGRDIRIRPLGTDSHGQKFQIIVRGKTFGCSMKLAGRHQLVNAAVSVGIIGELIAQKFKIADQAVVRGIAHVFWPLRFETVALAPRVIVDGAHHPQSCRFLARTLREVLAARKVILIFACSDDKDVRSMAAALRPVARAVIVTAADHPRAMKWTKQSAQSVFRMPGVLVTDQVSDAVKMALQIARRQDVIVAAGSIFSSAQARKCFGTRGQRLKK